MIPWERGGEVGMSSSPALAKGLLAFDCYWTRKAGFLQRKYTLCIDYTQEVVIQSNCTLCLGFLLLACSYVSIFFL